jgi:hypothetical protein
LAPVLYTVRSTTDSTIAEKVTPQPITLTKVTALWIIGHQFDRFAQPARTPKLSHMEACTDPAAVHPPAIAAYALTHHES